MATPYDPNDPNNPMKPKPQPPVARAPVQAPTAQFQTARNAMNQRFNTQAQQTGDAIQRRFAAMGSGNSGAAIKAAQLAQEQVAGQREQAAGQLDLQEAQQNTQLAEAQRGRDFQSGEAQLGREFQSGEAQKGRDFELPFKREGMDLQRMSTMGQLDLARQEMGMKKDEQDLNTLTALKQQGFNQNLLAALPEDLLLRLGIKPEDLGIMLEREGTQGAYDVRKRYLDMRAGR